ncbi:SMP-30/gluconolactonase/LRE family protein [Parahaliea mediterranea]|uniref:SMP-30/gluconolactonase/LRE family protein n=1 Tax=Parahaliea mediterranea TaxID=651086 RepID=UPI000E2F67D9|nr:SMP-30/gluconolactonase/LRE family protein [Parahaliea mediterranea]
MPALLIDGLAYPECPRWHEGHLWFSDQHAGYVYCVTEAGQVVESFSVPGGPSGLGWLPSGELLVVSMAQKRLFRRGDDKRLKLLAELGDVHPGESNDLVAASSGAAYIGNIGFDFNAGEAMRTTNLARVSATGEVSVAASELMVPNGSVITSDGKQLLVAESWAHRITAFDIDDSGQLQGRRTWAALGEHVPDGICLDAEGCIWFASPFAGGVFRVRAGGEIVDEIRVENGNAYACALGGSDGHSLFVCVAPDHVSERTLAEQSGHILSHRVAVPAPAGASEAAAH